MVNHEDYWEYKRKRTFKIFDTEYHIEITEKSTSPYPEIKIERHTPTGHHSKWIEQMTFTDPYEVELLLKNVIDIYRIVEEDITAKGIYRGENVEKSD